jgi:putative spermidine/putrescine transport system permease protein
MPSDVVSWQRFLWFAAFICFLLLALPQAAFIWMSFHADLGLGQMSDMLSLQNYTDILTDPFYLHALGLTIFLSAATAVIGLLAGFPTAYALARIGGRIAAITLSLILTTSLITVVVKLIGLEVILGASGLVNQLLLALSVIAAPLQLMNNALGVLIGLLQYSMPMVVILLFGVVQTIPFQLEEAAAIHGATRLAIYWRLILPIAGPGLLSVGLIAFNMSMGAFTSALLLGGGRVRTMPVLIQQIVIQDNSYGKGAALATLLLIFVFAMNLAVGGLLAHRRPAA